MRHQKKVTDWFTASSTDGRSNDYQFLSAHEAARLCGVDTENWWVMVSNGLVPAGIRINGRMMWQREVLHEQIKTYGLPGASKHERS